MMMSDEQKVSPLQGEAMIPTIKHLWLSLLFLVVGAAIALGQTTQLSHGQPFSEVYLAQSFPQATTERVVYSQDVETNGAYSLWSAPLAGGAPVRLSNALLPGHSVKFAITPDGQRVVYRTDQTTRGVPEVYSVPIGGGTITKLNKDLAPANGRVRDFIISPASQRVYYAADADLFTVLELWSVPIGGGPSTQINKAFAVDYDVFENYQASAADQVVYRVGRTVQGGHELWMVPGSGHGSQARRISISPMVTGGGVASDFQIVGDHVVYRADALDNGREDLFSVAVAGGVSTRIDRQDGRSVRKFVVDGESVVYSYTNSEWYRVPILGGASVAVAPPVMPPVTSPDGRYRVYEVGASLWREDFQTGLHRRVSCLGQVVATTWLGRPTYSVTADSQAVVYVADDEVFASPISGAVCRIFADGFETGNQGAWQ